MTETEAEFPVANVSDARRPWWSTLSKMWIVCLACLILAIALTWHSADSPGTSITIRFTDGHGLKAGDTIRHRGIEIGHIEDVSLDPSLKGIHVEAVLHDNAKAIACAGSRFWIVRPQLGLTGISGLETAVGAKYIAVIPGDGTILQKQFDGLAAEPPEGLRKNGIEIVLRGDDRFGVNPGSPLTWRGIEVGQVLSSSLSPDAMHVDTRVRVLEPYRKLLSHESKFWANSGIQMGLDLSGFELNAESLATIAKGGIAFITPQSTDSREVRSGDVFTLHRKREDDWVTDAIPVNLMQLDAPPTETVVAKWKQKHFGIPRSHSRIASGLVVASEQGTRILVPADMVHVTEAEQDSLTLTAGNEEATLTIPAVNERDVEQLLVAINLPDALQVSDILSPARHRSADAVEDCFAVRRTQQDAKKTVVIEMIGREQLQAHQGIWRCNNTHLTSETWHGAAVVSSSDEKVIGMLVVSDEGPLVVPLPSM